MTDCKPAMVGGVPRCSRECPRCYCDNLKGVYCDTTQLSVAPHVLGFKGSLCEPAILAERDRLRRQMEAMEKLLRDIAIAGCRPSFFERIQKLLANSRFAEDR